jgi:hypothetical protein
MVHVEPVGENQHAFFGEFDVHLGHPLTTLSALHGALVKPG